MSMILRAVGFEHVRNYEASIYEWSADFTLPVEK